MSGQLIEVTDHALVRWLERALGMDLETFRSEIREAYSENDPGELGAAPGAAIYVDCPKLGLYLVVRDGEVTTILFAGAEKRS